MSARRHATALETVHVTVPDEAVEAYERALASVCTTIGIFEADDTQTLWRIEGVKDEGAGEPALAMALSIAAAVTGVAAPLGRTETESEGWLARTYSSFPEQRVGRRFAIRGPHRDGCRVWRSAARPAARGSSRRCGRASPRPGCARVAAARRSR